MFDENPEISRAFLLNAINALQRSEFAVSAFVIGNQLEKGRG